MTGVKALSLFISLGLFVTLFHQQSVTLDPTRFPSDLQWHIHSAQRWSDGESITKILPHFGLQAAILITATMTSARIPDAAVWLLSMTMTLTAYLMYRLLDHFTGRAHPDYAILLGAAALMLVSAVYVPVFNDYFYLGQGGPNAWHNPTIILLKPFAILATVLTPGLLLEHERRGLSYPHALLSLLLLLSTLIKPSFMIAYIPALFLLALLHRSMSFRFYLSLCMVLAPPLLLLLYQYFITYTSGGIHESGVVIDVLGVWRLYSSCIPASLLQLTAFPLVLFAFQARRVMRNKHLLLSWSIFVVAVLQYMFLAETAFKYTHGNFGWGMDVGIQLIFLFSLVEYLGWLKRLPSCQNRRWNMVAFTLTSVLLLAHLASGILYFAQVFTGGSYY